MNARGTVVGFYKCPVSTHYEAFRWSADGGFETLVRPPGVTSAVATDINDNGVIVGAMSLFGVDPAISLAYAVVGHVTYFVITGIIGIIGFWQQGESLGEVYNQLLRRGVVKEV